MRIFPEAVSCYRAHSVLSSRCNLPIRTIASGFQEARSGYNGMAFAWASLELESDLETAVTQTYVKHSGDQRGTGFV